jgi:Gpi18-like mannosyltransferase
VKLRNYIDASLANYKKVLYFINLLTQVKAFKWRAAINVTIILFIKILYSILLYVSLGGYSNFYVPVMDVWKTSLPFNFLYLFAAWDTGHYIMIANSWYSPDRPYLWAFFPLYPGMIKALTFIKMNIWISAFIISIVFGTLSIILFQKIAEKYLSKNEALKTTLFYFLFPPVFVFLTACYTEPIFLFFSLLSWYFHLSKNKFKSALSMMAATMSRPNGILTIIPITYDYLVKRKLKSLIYVVPSILILFCWGLYSYKSTGDPFMLLSARLYWKTDKIQAIKTAFLQLLQGKTSLFFMLQEYFYIGLIGLFFIGLTLFLSYRVWKINRALGLYGFTSILAIICFGFSTSYVSFPRLISFIFPIGLGLNFKNSFFTIMILISFIILDYAAWLFFLTTSFFH